MPFFTRLTLWKISNADYNVVTHKGKPKGRNGRKKLRFIKKWG